MKFYTFQYYKCTLCIVKSLAYKPFAWPTSAHLKFRDVWELCPQNGSVTALFCSRLSWNRLPNRLSEQFELLITSHVTNFNLDKCDQVRIKWTILKVQQQDFVKFKCVTEVKHPRSLLWYNTVSSDYDLHKLTMPKLKNDYYRSYFNIP